MAIDTAEKRKSTAAAGCVWMAPGVTPNSDKDQEWRQQSGWGYSGIQSIIIIVTKRPSRGLLLGVY